MMKQAVMPKGVEHKWDVVGIVASLVVLLVLTVATGWMTGDAAAAMIRCDCPTCTETP